MTERLIKILTCTAYKRKIHIIKTDVNYSVYTYNSSSKVLFLYYSFNYNGIVIFNIN